MTASLGVLLACDFAISVWAQGSGGPIPRFEDYPLQQIYNGVPTLPKIVTPSQRRYRTSIREGVEKGWGVLHDGREQHRPGPNFAGKMIVVQWGCGAPCLMMAMVDAVTGEIYSLPLAIDDTLALPLLCIGNSVGRGPEVKFRQDSRLMVIKATPDYSKRNHHSYSHYYLWRDNRWSLSYRERLD